MELQERYDELDNIVRTLDNLIDEITDRNYIEQLQETKFEAEKELEEVQEELRIQEEQEQRDLEYEYMKEVI